MLNLISLLVWCSFTTPIFAFSHSLRSYAALGDSYAAGDGAGKPGLVCGRFSESFPVQIAHNLSIEHPNFRHLACGGASIPSVLHTQVPWIGSSDIVTLTAGGNEADFFAVLNECVHQWHPKSSCEAQCQKSRAAIESSSFIDAYSKMIKGTMNCMREDARLLVTGYATFFNQETRYCDNVTFSKTDPDQKLTRELRSALNDLVRRLNDVIRASAEVFGAEYVNMDAAFRGHRFCEDGVEEPSQRSGTWFFNLKYPNEDALTPTSNRVQQGLFDPFKDFIDLTKTFHPTSQGHTGIKEAIIRHLQEAPRLQISDMKSSHQILTPNSLSDS